MIEALVILSLIGVIITLLAFQAVSASQHRSQVNKLINTIVSRNAQDLSQLEMTDKTPSRMDVPQSQFVPESDLSDKEFDRLIGEANAQ